MKRLTRRISILETHHGATLQEMAQPPGKVIAVAELEKEVAEVGRSLFGDDAIAFMSFKQQAIEHITSGQGLSQLSDDELSVVERIVDAVQPKVNG